jgi:hypothetical protein
MPSEQDLNALTAAASLMAVKYKRAPRNMQDTINRAYKVLADEFKNWKKDNFNALQVRLVLRLN